MSTPTVTDIIREMRATLGTPEAWTKAAVARNAEGHPCSPIAPEASCWCLTGAMVRQQPPEALIEAVTDTLLAVAREEMGRPELFNLETFNDGRFTTYEEIVDLLNLAHLSARSASHA